MRETVSKFVNDLYKKVYWAEYNGSGYNIKNGILLAMYKCSSEIYFVISNGGITSCTVSHIKKYYLQEKDAWISCKDLGDVE